MNDPYQPQYQQQFPVYQQPYYAQPYPMQQKICRVCGFANSPYAKFCANCAPRYKEKFLQLTLWQLKGKVYSILEC